MLSGKRILLGVTGGIAAYKAVFLLREFQKQGAEIRVIMTPAATKFVGIETFAALSRNSVAVDVFNNNNPGDNWTKHIQWGEWADLFIVAPCTANSLSKLVHGQSDNMLTSTALAARCPILLCPTMDGEMYESPTVSKNLDYAKKLGFYIIEPESGYLASGIEAQGRLPEYSSILKTADSIIKNHQIQGPLTGKKVLVTAGPTREFLDPVRFLSNPSSGKMGIAMAEAAYALGGDVHLLHGPLKVDVPSRIESSSFISANDLFEQVQTFANSDVVIMTAAVSDFRPESYVDQKIKKEGTERSLKLIRNPDILSWLGKQKKEHQSLIGFAMETENLSKNAQEKRVGKNIDWICANSITGGNSGFESDDNTITLFGERNEKTFSGSKSKIASEILSFIFDEGKS